MADVVSDDQNTYIYNIIADQGETFVRTFTWYDDDDNPVNNSGYTAVMKVRKLYPATLLVPAHYDAAVISLTELAGITLSGANGAIIVTVADTVMAAVAPGIYNYDLELKISSTTTKIAKGIFEVRAEASF